jgi:hypothetical protein
MSVADDFGRFFADTGLLRGHLYPRQLNKVSDADVGKWLGAVQAAGLVSVYLASDGERYLEIVNFGQQVRAQKSKYPDPRASDSKCLQWDANASVFVFGDVGVIGSSSPAATPALPDCAYEEIVALYHEHLPQLPRVKLMSDKRKDALRKFWVWLLTSKKASGERRATDRETALSWIEGYFTRARDNDFLMGRTERSGPHANWECDIDFLVSERGLKQVIEKTREAA